MGNIEWAERGRNAWMGGANRPDLVFASGHGSWLVDVEGREYLDFVSGWAVCALGHAAPEVADALREQAVRLVHCSPGYWNPQAVELAERLKGITGMDRVFLGCTGAEANECAIKLARKWGRIHKGGAFRIVSTWKGFHGRTLATMAATGKSEWTDLFGPGCPGFDHVEFGDLAALEASIDHRTCAVMLEPIQGEGGVKHRGRRLSAGGTGIVRSARDSPDRRRGADGAGAVRHVARLRRVWCPAGHRHVGEGSWRWRAGLGLRDSFGVRPLRAWRPGRDLHLPSAGMRRRACRARRDRESGLACRVPGARRAD